MTTGVTFMLGDHHDLISEFPEMEGRIRELMANNAEFAKLSEEYHSIDDEIYDIEEQIETPSDEYTEQRKLKRVQLKDKLYAMLKD